MGDLPDRLRRARERAGITIEEISARTKIKPLLLHALERGEFERLPGEFFTRAFLRAYATQVHLSPAEVLEEYDRERGVLPAAALAEARPPDVSEERRAEASGFRIPSPGSAWPFVLLVAGILVFTTLPDRDEPQASAPEPQAVGTSGSAAPAPTATPMAPAPAPPPAAQRLRIEIRPTRAVWVTGSADGERVLYRTLEPGERVTIEADETLQFRVGDAGAFEYLLNGSPGRPPGRPGEVRGFRITHENYQTFLQ